MTRLALETIESLDGFRRLAPEWRALEARLPAVPFVTFDWADAWWKHLRSERLTAGDELFVQAFRDEAGELCGIAPLMRTFRPNFGPFRSQQLQFFGADPNITEIRGIIAPEDQAVPVMNELLEFLKASDENWDWLQFTGVSSDAQMAAITRTFGEVRTLRDVPNYYLNLAPTWDEFKKGLSRNIKESLRKCYNAPKRDGLKLDFTVLKTRSEVEPALAGFFRLHEKRSHLKDTVQHANVFASLAGRNFLVDICRRYAARDGLRIFQLKIGGAVVATRIGFVCRDSLYLYYSGYDPEFSKYSVMTTTLAESIQYAIGQGFRTVGLSTGKDVSKMRWSPEETMYRDVLVIPQSARSALSYRVYDLARRSAKKISFAAFAKNLAEFGMGQGRAFLFG